MDRQGEQLTGGVPEISGAVIVQPGDLLIVALKGHSTAEDVRAVSEHFQRVVPPSVRVTVLDGVRALAVVKGGADAHA